MESRSVPQTSWHCVGLLAGAATVAGGREGQPGRTMRTLQSNRDKHRGRHKLTLTNCTCILLVTRPNTLTDRHIQWNHSIVDTIETQLGVGQRYVLLIRDVPLIWSVSHREVPLYVYICTYVCMYEQDLAHSPFHDSQAALA